MNITDQEIAQEALEDALAGDAECQAYVGVCHLYGWDGFDHDVTQAAHWLRRAADQGVDRARWNLAALDESSYQSGGTDTEGGLMR